MKNSKQKQQNPEKKKDQPTKDASQYLGGMSGKAAKSLRDRKSYLDSIINGSQ